MLSIINLQFWVIAVHASVQMSCKNVITTSMNTLTFTKLSTLRTDVIILILIVCLTFTVEANKFDIFVMWYNCIMLNLSPKFVINLSFKCNLFIFLFIYLAFWKKKRLYFQVCVCLSRVFLFAMAWNKQHVKAGLIVLWKCQSRLACLCQSSLSPIIQSACWYIC